MNALATSGNVIFLPFPRRMQEDAEASRLNRNGWIVVVVAAIMLAALVGAASVAPKISPEDLDPSALVD